MTPDDSKDFVKRIGEVDIITDKISIPDISELKDVHEKPIVIRKINSLLDLIHKENLKGDELSILLSFLIDNLDIYVDFDDNELNYQRNRLHHNSTHYPI